MEFNHHLFWGMKIRAENSIQDFIIRFLLCPFLKFQVDFVSPTSSVKPFPRNLIVFIRIITQT
eukprot:UN14210